MNEKYGILFMIFYFILRVIPLKRFIFTVNSEIKLLELFLKRKKHRFPVNFKIQKENY